MTPSIIAWSMCASAALILAIMHFTFWLHDKKKFFYLLSALMAFSSSLNSIVELSLMHSQSLESSKSLLRWGNLCVFGILIPMVWYVQNYFTTGKKWLAVVISVLWSVAIIINFQSPASLVFSQVTELKQSTSFWGETFTIPLGVVNPWKILPDAASLLILVYVGDATFRLWRRKQWTKTVFIGSAIVFFIVSAGIHTPLVDAGLIETPYMISFSFLAIVLTMSYQMVTEAIAAGAYNRQITANEKRWHTLLEKVQLLVISLDHQGTIDYINPYYEQISGYTKLQLSGKHFLTVSPKELTDQYTKLFASAMDGDLPQNLQLKLQTQNGQIRNIEWSNVLLFDVNGKTTGLLSIGTDISEHQKTENERNQALLDMYTALKEVEMLKTQYQDQAIYLRNEIDADYHYGDFIGSSDALKYIEHKISQVASHNTVVLIEGETGVGKELVARSVHKHSARCDKPLIKVNCAALPANLIETELFGHEKGAFTGADKIRKGRFELADGGTLFLDEIGEMPLAIQAKLLRALQEGEIERIGSQKSIKIDVRIIAATNRELLKEVERGNFRSDLFYRLHVFPITVAPLRQRKTDIPVLTNTFVNQFCKQQGKFISLIPQAVLDQLTDYDWPGNIRELQNVLERAVIITLTGHPLALAEKLSESRVTEEKLTDDLNYQ
ncbi:MAG: PAS domain S-box protein, partial [Methylomarinum sp.]|nr:PAS domain S-box protein [Methylomarinum sp.]